MQISFRAQSDVLVQNGNDALTTHNRSVPSFIPNTLTWWVDGWILSILDDIFFVSLFYCVRQLQARDRQRLSIFQSLRNDGWSVTFQICFTILQSKKNLFSVYRFRNLYVYFLLFLVERINLLPLWRDDTMTYHKFTTLSSQVGDIVILN